ncbi:MAG: cell division protein SepF [Thermoplasmata archaeon]|nr:cell division protein SepF [Thermoplasmata archaeon]
MAFIKKPFRRLHEGGTAGEADTYIDLGELNFESEGGALGEPVEHLVKVAEVYRYEDIADLTTHVFNGNILMIDYTSLASDELALKRITAELKSAVRDCGGDVAVVGKNILMATPAGIKIDRTKIKGAF